MAKTAKVTSVDAIKDFRVAYSKLVDESRVSLDTVRMQISKFHDYLTTDLVGHWKTEIKQRQRDLAEANTALQRKRLGTGHAAAGTSAEKSDVRKAKERLEFAERKLKAIAKWSRTVTEASRNFDGHSKILSSMLEADAARGARMLDGVIRSLEAYVRLQAPPGGGKGKATTATSAQSDQSTSMPLPDDPIPTDFSGSDQDDSVQAEDEDGDD